jgi:hypothetical protein
LRRREIVEHRRQLAQERAFGCRELAPDMIAGPPMIEGERSGFWGSAVPRFQGSGFRGYGFRSFRF